MGDVAGSGGQGKEKGSCWHPAVLSCSPSDAANYTDSLISCLCEDLTSADEQNQKKQCVYREHPYLGYAGCPVMF